MEVSEESRVNVGVTFLCCMLSICYGFTEMSRVCQLVSVLSQSDELVWTAGSGVMQKTLQCISTACSLHHTWYK